MNELEKETRKKRIDKRLSECGWQIVTYVPGIPSNLYTCHAVREYPTQSGPVDYALFYDGIIIGVIEAKKLSLGPQNILTQAQRYAQGISQSNFNFDGFRVPFIYSTNGEIFWFQDLRERNSYSRKTSKFHTPEWVWAKIEEIGQVKGGKRLPKGHELLEKKTPYPYIRGWRFKEWHGAYKSNKVSIRRNT